MIIYDYLFFPLLFTPMFSLDLVMSHAIVMICTGQCFNARSSLLNSPARIGSIWCWINRQLSSIFKSVWQRVQNWLISIEFEPKNADNRHTAKKRRTGIRLSIKWTTERWMMFTGRNAADYNCFTKIVRWIKLPATGLGCTEFLRKVSSNFSSIFDPFESVWTEIREKKWILCALSL